MTHRRTSGSVNLIAVVALLACACARPPELVREPASPPGALVFENVSRLL